MPSEARLIAAAPDLLEALQVAAWRFDFLAKQLRRLPDLAGLAPSLDEAATDARAAIAKALGADPKAGA